MNSRFNHLFILIPSLVLAVWLAQDHQLSLVHAPLCCTNVLHYCVALDCVSLMCCTNLSASPPCQGQEPTLSVQTGYIQSLQHSEWLCIITLDIMMFTRKQVKPVVKVYLPIPPLQPFDKVGCITGLQTEPRSKSKCRFGLKSSPVKSS